MNIKIDNSQYVYLEDFFHDLSLYDQKQVFMEAFRGAAKPLIGRMKTLAPKRTGKLIQSIGSKPVPNEIALLVGAMRPKGSHGHLMEDGTAERTYMSINGKPHRTGKIVGIHFIEQAYDDGTEKEVLDAVEFEMYKAIDNLIVKINKKLK